MSDREVDRDRAETPAASEPRDAAQSDDGEGFLQRWSRRKHRAAREERPHATVDFGPGNDTDDRPGSEAPPDVADQLDAAEKPEPEPPGDADMPPLDSIDQGGSVRDFFSPKVSKKLRGAALKRLFSQPEFAAPDLLDEYAGDYSKPEPLGDTVTAEMRYRAEQALKFAERKLKEAAEQAGKVQEGSPLSPALDPGVPEDGAVSSAADQAHSETPAEASTDGSAKDPEIDSTADRASRPPS